LTMRS